MHQLRLGWATNSWVAGLNANTRSFTLTHSDQQHVAIRHAVNSIGTASAPAKQYGPNSKSVTVFCNQAWLRQELPRSQHALLLPRQRHSPPRRTTAAATQPGFLLCRNSCVAVHAKRDHTSKVLA